MIIQKPPFRPCSLWDRMQDGFLPQVLQFLFSEDTYIVYIWKRNHVPQFNPKTPIQIWYIESVFLDDRNHSLSFAPRPRLLYIEKQNDKRKRKQNVSILTFLAFSKLCMPGSKKKKKKDRLLFAHWLIGTSLGKGVWQLKVVRFLDNRN